MMLMPRSRLRCREILRMGAGVAFVAGAPAMTRPGHAQTPDPITILVQGEGVDRLASMLLPIRATLPAAGARPAVALEIVELKYQRSSAADQGEFIAIAYPPGTR